MKDLIKAQYKEAKESRDPEILNDFLIELGKNPDVEYISFLDFFMNDLEKRLYEKIKLNLIYVLGEIGNLTPLSNDYLQFLYNTFYISDRWIRGEIVLSIEKISKNSPLDSNIIELIGKALRDDYLPVRINALKIILNLKNLPELILKSLFHVLNSKNSEVLEGCERILAKFSLDTNFLFNALNNLDNYKILKPRAIRSLLLMKFKSITNLETLREFVINTKWDASYKEQYLKEIDTMHRILLRSL